MLPYTHAKNTILLTKNTIIEGSDVIHSEFARFISIWMIMSYYYGIGGKLYFKEG